MGGTGQLLPLLSTATNVYMLIGFDAFMGLIIGLREDVHIDFHEEVNALETFASMVKIVPWGIDFLKETLFTEAVTTMVLLWRCAAIAEHRSIQLSSCPPKRLFRLLVSLGKTSSVMIVNESDGCFAFIRCKSIRWVGGFRAAFALLASSRLAKVLIATLFNPTAGLIHVAG